MADLWVWAFIFFLMGRCERCCLLLLGKVGNDAPFSGSSLGEREILGSENRFEGEFEGVL